jgi:hypothetical protein
MIRTGTFLRLLVLPVGLAVAFLGCGEKVPYPPTTGKGPGSPPTAAPGTPAAGTSPGQGQGVEPAPQPLPEASPPRPVAVVRTPEGSFLVSARRGGTDLAVRKVPGLALVRADGGVGVVRVLPETARAATGAPESRFVRLSFRADGKEGDVPLPDAADRPDLVAAAKADPDLAGAFYHRETLTAAGMWGGKVAYVAAVEGFLGGAHPYASRRLVVLDLATGHLDDASSRFAEHDLAAEVLGKARETTCTRRPAGVAAVEGRGGESAWVVGLAHDVESCAGEFRVARVPGPGPDAPRPTPPAEGPGKDGVLRLAEAVTAGPVADWRLAGTGGAAVLLMGADRNDRAASPWEAAAGRRGTGAARELRFWQPGMTAPAVLGRASAILSVQFLEGTGDPRKVQEALDRL